VSGPPGPLPVRVRQRERHVQGPVVGGRFVQRPAVDDRRFGPLAEHDVCVASRRHCRRIDRSGVIPAPVSRTATSRSGAPSQAPELCVIGVIIPTPHRRSVCTDDSFSPRPPPRPRPRSRGVGVEARTTAGATTATATEARRRARNPAAGTRCTVPTRRRGPTRSHTSVGLSDRTRPTSGRRSLAGPGEPRRPRVAVGDLDADRLPEPDDDERTHPTAVSVGERPLDAPVTAV